mgnify:CR=1 FL=1
MKCSTLEECFRQIKNYVEAPPDNAPLIINSENWNDYHELRKNLPASLKVIYVSDYAEADQIPYIEDVLSDISGEGDFAVFGLSQFFMLQGEKALQNFIADLFNLRRLKGHAVIILFGCREVIQNYTFVDKRSQIWSLLLEGPKSRLPELRFIKYREFANENYCEGFKQMLQTLELFHGDLSRVIFIHTSFSQALFVNSMYPLSSISDPYIEAAKKFEELSEKIKRSFGTEEEWLYLYKALKPCENLSGLIFKRFGSPENFPQILAEVFSRNSELEKWLFWLSMKIFYIGKNDYLEFVLSFTENYRKLIHEIYCAFLRIPASDARFMNLYSERKFFISHLPENLPEIEAVLEQSEAASKSFPFYLTDTYEDEKFEFMKIIAENEFSESEIYNIAAHSFPELRLYMEDFTFDRTNTHLREKDADFREVLNDYFHDYKLQKIRNRLDENFLSRVEQFASEKPFYKLQPRSSVLQDFNPEEVQAYFFDALGVEFLGYIKAKSKEYGLKCAVKICRCNLPSTTAYNKEFVPNFNPRCISSLDEIKHHGVKFNYKPCKYPLHIFHELEIIDRELRRISAELIRKKFSRALIISDHGASRLVVLHNQKHDDAKENKPRVYANGERFSRFCLSEKSKKSRNAPGDPRLLVLSDYSLIKGSRCSSSELHGGSTLEEVTIPLISLSIEH